MRPALCAAALLAVLALPACGERDQSMAEGRRGAVDEPWRGAQNGYAVKAWTPSDKAGWENQLRQRAQSQNEYNRVN